MKSKKDFEFQIYTINIFKHKAHILLYYLTFLDKLECFILLSEIFLNSRTIHLCQLWQ